MKTESDLKMTDLDYLTASPHLQMIKAALPYIHVPEQRFFSMIVKLSELNRTMKLFEQKEDGMVGICSRIYQSYRASAEDGPAGAAEAEKSSVCGDEEDGRGSSSRPLRGGPHFSIEHLKNMLPPEQQSKLETAQLLMQTMQGI